MTLDARGASLGTGMSRQDLLRRIGDLATLCVVLVAYLLSQCDHGIQGDAQIYLGRALADLDPQGIGRDILFVHDGQSGYSVFRFVARFAVAHIGLERTAQTLDLAAALAWLAAMAALVSTLRPGRAFPLVLAAAVLLPRWYTPWSGLGAGEALAVPRPFAEALVLLALALLARQRLLGSGLALCGAAALHPIMALPGFGVLFFALVAKDRRWALLGIVAALGVAAAAALGNPLLARALVVIDPGWLAILQDRLQYLFATRWPSDAGATILLQLLTILIASVLVPPPSALILRAAVAVAVGGFALSAVLCDGLHLLLFAQAQLWRSLWLAAALAPLAFGICIWRLPALGTRGLAALAALVAAWACFRLQPLGAAFALLSVAILAFETMTASRTSRLAIFAVAGLAALLSVAIDAAYASRVDSDEARGSIAFVWHLTIWTFAIVGFAALAARRPGRTLAFLAVPLALALVAVLLAGYDDRSPAKADRDAGRLKPDLVSRLASRPGEVLWLGGDELWYWTRRANWSASIQGAAVVFSRDLAMIWHDRAEALVSHGLASRNYIVPWALDAAHRPLAYDRSQIRDLCRRPDAPAWVVMPVDVRDPVPGDADVRAWTPPLQDEGEPKRRLIVPCHAT